MTAPSDIAIAQQTVLKPIKTIAEKLGLSMDDLEPYGHYTAKINSISVLNKPTKAKNSKLILVTAINPTPAGEGKTTITIGLADALNRLHQWHNTSEATVVALREPSIGSVFGIKGGATGHITGVF